MLDESKKDKSKRRAGTVWSREGQRTGITQTMALQRLTDINNQIKDVEAARKQKRDLWLEADRIRHDAAVHQRKVAKSGSRQEAQTTINNQPKPAKSDQEQQAETELRSARKTADTAFLSWLKRTKNFGLRKPLVMRSRDCQKQSRIMIHLHSNAPTRRDQPGRTLQQKRKQRTFSSTAFWMRCWLIRHEPLGSTLTTRGCASSIRH